MAKSVQTFGKYQILERIATGGMAEIYKARLEGIGGFQRTFAIKRILPNLSQNADYIAMLVDEAKVAGLLSHANIVQILDLGQVDDVWYIAMEYVEGPDLGAVLRRAHKKGLVLPVPHAVFTTIELLKGLEYAHQRQVMRGGRPVPLNIIHRDISPPNILLSFQGEVKLTDFGIARASLKVMETVSGIIKGRFDYMSSEQAAGSRDLDQRSDLFSVGIVLYEMLTGKHPFRADNEIATVERVRTGRYTPVHEVNPEVPFALETIVDRALRADRDERYPSATAFKEALDKFFHDSGFIFTHATLATYVKGLFPDADARGSVVPQSPARGATPVDDDGPTRVLDQSVLKRELARGKQGLGVRGGSDGESTAIQPNPLLQAQARTARGFDDEQETLIRKSQGWEDDQETLIRSQGPPGGGGAGWGDDPETIIRKGDSLGDPDAHDTWVAPLQEEDDVELLTASLPAPPAPPPPAPKKRPPPRRSGGIGWLGLFMSILMLALGLIGGAMIAGPAVFFFTGANQAEVVLDPQVRVKAPPRTVIKLDGDAVGTEFRCSPDQPHELVIRVPGYKPLRRELVLRRGETYVYLIEGLEKR